MARLSADHQRLAGVIGVQPRSTQIGHIPSARAVIAMTNETEST
jgi:hypothetical protein